jgi:import inner membrane translocase subunit TIM10
MSALAQILFRLLQLTQPFRIDMVSDVFNRIVASVAFFIITVASTDFTLVHVMCISPRYAEGDLNKGESVCIDRCVAKFFEVNKKVGEKMQSAGASAQATGGTSFSL